MKYKHHYIYLYTLIGILFLVSDIKGQTPVLTTSFGHTSSVMCVAYSPDGKYIISGGKDNAIKIWDVKTGLEIRTITGHSDFVTSIAFSPDGKHIVSGSWDNTGKIWDIQTGVEIRTLRWNWGNVNSVAYSPDGKFIVSGSHAKTIKIWDAQTGKLIRTLEGHTGYVKSVSFSPDGKYIVSGGGSAIKLWNAKTGLEIWTMDGSYSWGWVNSVAFSPDGRYIISGNNYLGINLLEARTGREIGALKGHLGEVNSVAFSPDGMYYVSGSADKTIKLRETKTGRELSTMIGHSGGVNCVAFSPDSKYLVSGSHDYTVKIWDVKTGKEIKTLTGQVPDYSSVDFSPNGRYIAWGLRDNTIGLWDTKAGSEIKSLSGHTDYVKSVAFSPDDKSIASISDDKNIRLWDTQSGNEIRTMKGHSDIVNSIAFSADGKYVVSGSEDKTIRLWDTKTGEKIWKLKGHRDRIFRDYQKINCVNFSSDGKYIVSGSWNSLKLWDTKTGSEIRTMDGFYVTVTTVAFSPDSKYLVSGDWNSLKLWDTQTGREIRKMDANTRTRYHNNVDFSSDGKYIVSPSGKDTIKLWDAKTGQEIRTFHISNVRSQTFTPNGKYIISSSYDGKIRVWEINSGKLLVTLRKISNSDDIIIYTPDGRFDGTEKGMELLYYVKGMDIIPLSSLFEQFYTPNLFMRILNGEKFDEMPFDPATEMLLPPELTIIDPIPGIENSLFRLHESGNILSTRENINITYSVADKGGGISEIRIFQNGNLIERDDFVDVPSNKVTQKIVTISLLSNAKNVIRITAYNEQQTEASPQEISIIFEGTKATSDLYLFCIGINDYKNTRYNLNYAKSDAIAFTSAIKKGSKQLFDKIFIDTLFNENAIKPNISNTFNSIISRTKKEDVLIFYFSGHGTMSIPVDGEDSEFYLVPYDVTEITSNDILKEKAISTEELGVFTIKTKATKKLYVFDACESGAGVDELLAYLSKSGSDLEKALAIMARAQGIFLFAAASEKQKAYEEESVGHGIFTYTLLQALNEADYGSDNQQENNIITTDELWRYIKEEYTENTLRFKGIEIYPMLRSGSKQEDFAIISKN